MSLNLYDNSNCAVCIFCLQVTFIFVDALTNRANNEGRRLEVTGAEIDRLKKGN